MAVELTEHDALTAHLSAELNIDPDDLVSPWHAALASAVGVRGRGAPALGRHAADACWDQGAVTFIAVLVALAVTGTTGAYLGGSSKVRASLRVVIGGAVALAFTYGIGRALGVSVWSERTVHGSTSLACTSHGFSSRRRWAHCLLKQSPASRYEELARRP